MADHKVTKMVMKVDLQCSKCYRKIKKVLCHFPQIRDQVYDEKQNTVTITVVCCSPEKIKEKIACKAGDTVESIEIVPDKLKESEKTKESEKQKLAEKSKETEKLKPVEKPKDPPPTPLPSLPVPVVQVRVCCCCCCDQGAPCYHGRRPMCCDQGAPCYHGRRPMCCDQGAPCYHGRCPMCYDGCGRPAYECSGGNRGYYVNRCD